MTMTQKEHNAEIIDEQRIQIAKLISETAKIQAEIHEVNAQTKKLTAESKWYPVVVASSLIAAGATAATLFIKLFH
ncbi:hypothetical protein LZ757_06335 [Xylella fastidiosa subsp. morus]|uniref:Phage-related protein n=1 Tax=Xylella fastidiosa subsp. multiplex TaxID=644357 RepID=A0A9Q4QRM2_XYLFS|nr:hypothetical protein [Xylella fastidiosa]AIC12440.1 hypothetical protein P303_04850 [Xylella fastidiosa MUL0034]MBE0269558.1 hypothetical protein [Xylella fastidiosa subsp. multiplex]MBE0276265.1 hypothetical protein [Xylella fastidiosa subsp. multiplex]MBE0278813.1 hypothetical protein [Xylella fastidiosa subsp. multiplex]MBE0283105.1 hypothetical protein [Xylella fastidiosa subsp. multiplex]